MKKLLLIALALMVSLSISVSAAKTVTKKGNNPTKVVRKNTNPTKPSQRPNFQRRGMGGSFGISQEDYNNLNLSQAQKKKIEAIRKKYRPEFKQGQRLDTQKMMKNREAEHKEFRSILTKDQKAKYDKAVQNRKAQMKKMTVKRYNQIAAKLNLTAAQKKRLDIIIDKYWDKPMELNREFDNTLTKKQKEELKKMFQGQRNMGGPGMRPNGPRPNGQRPNRQHK